MKKELNKNDLKDLLLSTNFAQRNKTQNRWKKNNL